MARQVEQLFLALRRVRFRANYRYSVLTGRVSAIAPPSLDAPLWCDGDGQIQLGERVQFGFHLAPATGDGSIRLQARYQTSRISIGAGTVISNNVTIIATHSVQIGPDSLIGDHTQVLDSNFHHTAPDRRNAPNPPAGPIELGARVWIGSRVTILKGVRIGSNSVIAACAVVTSDIPDGAIAAGVPARVVGSANPDMKHPIPLRGEPQV